MTVTEHSPSVVYETETAFFSGQPTEIEPTMKNSEP